MALITPTTLPVTSSFDNLGESAATLGASGGANRDNALQHNALLSDLVDFARLFTTDGVLVATVLSRGTTVTLAATASTITISGVPVVVAAQTAQAFGALGTIPASTWGIVAVDAVAAGTLTFVSGTANYTTGYATEALAIAAFPAKTANKARLGYLTVLASASTFIFATDSLAGGATGNPATTTNYYPMPSPLELSTPSANLLALGAVQWQSKQVGNMAGTALII